MENKDMKELFEQLEEVIKESGATKKATIEVYEPEAVISIKKLGSKLDLITQGNSKDLTNMLITLSLSVIKGLTGGDEEKMLGLEKKIHKIIKREIKSGEYKESTKEV